MQEEVNDNQTLNLLFNRLGGDELYPTIQAKAARLGYGLIKNHCMKDIHDIFLQLEDNYFYQVAYQEYAKEQTGNSHCSKGKLYFRKR